MCSASDTHLLTQVIMATTNRWIPKLFTPQMFWRMCIGTTALLGLTAWSVDINEPTGGKQYRAEQRRAECQRVHNITNAHYEQNMAAYRQGLATDGTQTQAGLLKQAEVPIRTADILETLELEDKSLQSVSSYIAMGLRQMARADRAMALFANIERTITSANERSAAHQASVVQKDEASRYYAGALYTLEVYCEGGHLPSILENPIN